MPDSKREAVDLLLKASGFLVFCVRDVLSQMPPEVKYVYCLSLDYYWYWASFEHNIKNIFFF